MDVAIEESWKVLLKEEFEKPYFKNLVQYLKLEKEAGKIIYPAGQNIFNAFNTTPFDKVKVVLLGQDPYHGPRQAHGLCFSVQKDIPHPPSLVNIYKEMHNDLGLAIPKSGDLTPWAKQGVFMLNASLTVRAGEPMSHAKIGWATFTDAVLKKIAEKKKHVVFILWGGFAQQKAGFIDASNHFIIKSAHPSPLSAHRGFLGSKPFSTTNEYLVSQGIDPINWKIVDGAQEA